MKPRHYDAFKEARAPISIDEGTREPQVNEISPTNGISTTLEAAAEPKRPGVLAARRRRAARLQGRR